MFRSLLSIVAIAAVMAATLVLPTETQARRCPVEIPETLLSLYRGSDVIVIATYDKIEDGEVEKTEHYTMVKTKSYYTVATTLKGEQQKMLVLEDQDYRYEQADTADEAVTETSSDEESLEAGEADDSSEVKPGDTVLMFLAKGTHEEGEEKEETEKPVTLRPVGYRDGIKKMSGDVLRTYEHRVNQLNVIFNSAGNRDAAIVNWLIEVTEDPITRWEGAFELLQAVQELEWAEAEAKREAEAEKSESTEESEESEEAGTGEEESEMEETGSSLDRQRYAKLITDGHKQALLNILLSSVPAQAENEKPAEASRGDQALMQLVRNWGDARLAGFLLDQLRAGAGDSYHKYQLMETIAASLEDKKLAAIVEEYGERLYEEDDTVIEADEPDETEAVIEEPTAEPTEGETAETVEGDDGDPAKDVKKTYGERRAELIANFIYTADQRIAADVK